MKFSNPEWSDTNIKTNENCRRHCLGNCSCQAYTYYDNQRCWFWGLKVNNLQENYTGGFNLFIRIPLIVGTQGPLNTTMTSSRNQRPLVISISLILGVIILCGIGYIIYLNKRVERSEEAREIVLGMPMEYLPHRDSSDEDLITEGDKKRIDVPFFSLNRILVAIENFSNASKLGRVGFGPVYKWLYVPGVCIGGTLFN
ncbi:G-type lectin S-receptor-like serine/threonine-protein kinase At4g03230 isoform X2 [Solanum dulcamara]|uniref:G-type lectin S-receptor-like serine/threonine-protein kinase At4g03230 isoform X2 n=1 Tax=Solanum dulcamara TaxID=45834 RepID=UPI002484F370|nr:G-type lectin S-receptor-like serine/threonine-protein kinase At4g03230 isoform X2 [Solanum dulcamara]